MLSKSVVSKMKSIFFDSFLCSVILSTAYCFSIPLKNETSIRYLMTSSQGLQFYKIDEEFDRLGIVYDCSVGWKSNGVVSIFDDLHPKNITFITIENCGEITVVFKYCINDRNNNDFNFPTAIKVTVKNTRELKFRENSHCGRDYYGNYRSIAIKSRLILHLHNVKITTLESKAIISPVIELKLDDVNIGTVEEGGIFLSSNSSSGRVMTIKNSRIKNIHRRGIVIEGEQVEITNNSFNYLDDAAFSISANEWFRFSENHVKKIGSSLNVSSPVIEIVGNTFSALNKLWLQGISVSNDEYGLLNITKNAMNSFSYDLLELNTTLNIPGQIIFSQNMFNCTCQNRDYRDASTTSSFYNFLNSKNENVCQNLGNCSLVKVLRNMEDVCDDRFTCSDSNPTTTKSYMEMILSTLKNIASKLDVLINSRSYQNLTETNNTVSF